MKQLKASVWIMAILAVLLIIGSLVSSFGLWDGFYKSLFFLVMVVAFMVILVWCLVVFPFSVKKLGFYLCHIGIGLIIICSFIGWAFMKDTQFSIPINPNSFYGEVMMDDGSELSFGFKISIASFEVEKYEPDYRLFSSNETFTDETMLMETVIQNRKGIYDMGEYGTIHMDELKDANGYVKKYELDNGYTLVKLQEVDKGYKAVMQIQDGDTHNVEIAVNKPYTYKGWKFYLMGYDETNLQTVHLYAKKDPGNIPFAIGIWMTIVGTFMACLPISKRKEAAK